MARTNPVLFSYCVLIALTIAPAARADGGNRVSDGRGYVGVGTAASTSSTAGSSAGIYATVGGYDMAMGTNVGAVPTHAVIGSLQYNAAGATSSGNFTTGVSARAQFFVGGTLLGDNDVGCDIYLGLGGSVTAGVYANRRGDTAPSGMLSPETGLLCQGYNSVLGQVLFTLSPIVGLATGGSYSPTQADPVATGGKSNLIGVGTRVRLLAKGLGMLAAEGYTTPKIADGSGKTTEGKIDLFVQTGEKTMVGGYGRGIELKDQNGNAYAGGELGVSLLRAF